jgi:hypothetical protein
MTSSAVRKLFPGAAKVAYLSTAATALGAAPFAVEDADGVMWRLGEADVVVSARSGRIRISVHFFNSPDELDLVASLLSSSPGGGARTS